MPSTPEFVVWSLTEPCSLRENLDDYACPVATERLLRPLTAYAEAQEEHRVFEGIAVAADVQPLETASTPPLGFRVEEVLANYGGEAYVRSLCENCRANSSRRLAGCHGFVEFSPREQTAPSDLDRAIGADLTVADPLPSAPSLWRRLWIESEPSLPQRVALHQILQQLAGEDPFYASRLTALRAALTVSIEQDMPLRLQAFPAGVVEGRTWRLPEHCGRCKAPWRSGARRCWECGYQGGSQAARKRHARGTRPYWRLAGFLGEERVAEFLNRYLAQANSAT